jgi:23S rRNA (uracil1939-C5)-methyltransferase
VLRPEQQLELQVEKPAAGGRMIARHEGQVVLVLGAIPGERVLARIEKADRQLAFATTIDVLSASPDRREPFVDPLCGGCLYAHVSYPRQVRIKADIITDAFVRLGRFPAPSVEIEPSPEYGYRMRGRLYVHDGRVGFYREGSHSICDAASTRLLTDEAVTSAMRMADAFLQRSVDVKSVDVTENLAGSERALHVEAPLAPRLDASALSALVHSLGLTGGSARTADGLVIAFDPAVGDPLGTLTQGRAARGVLRRSAQSFFQANRFLLPSLVTAVMDAVGDEGDVLDLYAGVGLFAVALAGAGRSRATAVEGDRSSSADLLENAAQFPGAIEAVRDSVEGYLTTAAPTGRARTIVVDPPRTGISRAAMGMIAGYGAGRIVYVSCDPATMARDARRLVDAGYALESMRAFDLFPNTPHVETLAVFARGTGALGGLAP